MKLSPLPPMRSLAVFEATARLRSFTLAAEELNVTQGAVSRQIRQLEAYLGHLLFVREQRSVSLTETGIDYYEHIRDALHLVSDATAQVLQWQGEKQVTVVTTSAMASFWLLPRFRDFQNSHPDIETRILAVDTLKDMRQTEFDVGLFYLKHPPEGMHATPLFEERVFPVCSPDYMLRNPQARQPQTLSECDLLVLDSREDWVNWQQWFQACELPISGTLNKPININSYPLLIQAALNGNGLALAWQTLVDEYLNSGLLVAPVDTTWATSSQFYLLQPGFNQRPKLATTAFCRWLQEQTSAPKT